MQFSGLMTGTKDGSLIGSEDCLTLNVFAPRGRPTGAEPLPVMVWIHGGGNAAGTASTFPMAAQLAARRERVMVTINYRLGVLGWLRDTGLHGDDATQATCSCRAATDALIGSRPAVALNAISQNPSESGWARA